jgi:hypothetical protein
MAEDKIFSQDPDRARDRFGRSTAGAFETCFGSMLLSYPGEYLRENFHSAGSGTLGGGKTLEDGGGESVISEPVPVQHYEFDGFSIDVYGVASGGLLEDYLAEKGLLIPKGDWLTGYEGQYLAVVEGGAKPPIDEEAFGALFDIYPGVVEELEAELRKDPSRDARGIDRLYYDLMDMIHEDWQTWESLDRDTRDTLDNALEDLVDAVFGRTDFEGEVIHIDLPLDDGKVFFPLGTSEGWPNQVGDIDVLFRVPEDRDLDIDDTEDAYFDGSHWYLFSMENGNPGFDLESPLQKGSEDRRKEAERAAFIYESSPYLGPLLVIGLLALVWFGGAYALMRWHGKEGPVLRNQTLWLLLGLSLVLSIPGALLVYVLARPQPAKELLKGVSSTTPMLVYPVALVVFVVGGLL